MADYSTFIALADRLIGKRGGAATWKKHVTDAVADPATPWLPGTAPPPVTYQCTILLLPMNYTMLQSTLSLLASLGYERGTNVPTGTEQALLSGSAPFTPELADTCLFADGRELKVLNVDRLAPDATSTVLWTIQFKV